MWLVVESSSNLEIGRGVDVLPQDLFEMVERGRSLLDSRHSAAPVEGLPDGQLLVEPLLGLSANFTPSRVPLPPP